MQQHADVFVDGVCSIQVRDERPSPRAKLHEFPEDILVVLIEGNPLSKGIDSVRFIPRCKISPSEVEIKDGGEKLSAERQLLPGRLARDDAGRVHLRAQSRFPRLMGVKSRQRAS